MKIKYGKFTYHVIIMPSIISLFLVLWFFFVDCQRLEADFQRLKEERTPAAVSLSKKNYFIEFEKPDGIRPSQERDLQKYPISGMYYQHIMKKARKTRERLLPLVKAICQKHGGDYVIPPLKKLGRTLEKVNRDHGDFKKLCDLVRGTIHAQTPSQLHTLLAAFSKYYEIVYTKNRFCHPTKAGYRDFLVIFYDPEIDFYGEMQFNFSQILEAKDQAHVWYEELRSIEEKAGIQQRDLTKQEQQRIKILKESSKQLYEKAFNSVWEVELISNNVLFGSQKIHPGNPTHLVNAILSCISMDTSSFFAKVLKALNLLSDMEVNKALNRLHPAFLGGLEWIHLTQMSFVSDLIASKLSSLSCFLRERFSIHRPGMKNSLWIEPLGIFTKQKSLGQLRGFQSEAVGVTLGYDRFFRNVYVGTTFGYQSTDLCWFSKGGKGSIHTPFGGLYGRFQSPFFSLDLSAITGGNFYRLKRNIFFNAGLPNSNIDVIAKSHPIALFLNSYLKLTGNIMRHWVQCFASLDHAYLNLRSFKEKGASDLNLHIYKKISNMMKTKLGVTLSGNFDFITSCLTPYFSLGWVSKIPLSHSNYRFRFECGSDVFIVNTTTHHVNQVAFEAGMKILSSKGISLLASGSAEIGGRMKNYLASMLVDWIF